MIFIDLFGAVVDIFSTNNTYNSNSQARNQLYILLIFNTLFTKKIFYFQNWRVAEAHVISKKKHQ